jgi:phage-related baseplate assembly protein
MMQLSLQNFSSLVQTMAASVQASSRQLLDLTVGSVLRAALEANASVGLWMQWLILQVLQTTRAATSTGADLDSWMADFSLARLAAVPATGTVTVSRFTPSIAALVPVGALVRTADGTQTFVVVADASNPAFSVPQNGYVLASGVATLDVPVQAQLAGSAGNVQAASVTQLATAMPGVDAVSNAAPFQNGLDAETDGAFRDRFANYLNSRSRATPLAVGYAITSIQQGLQYTIQENQDTTGAWRPGSFVVTVDDGSGAPSAALVATVAAAIEVVRPVGSIYTVRPPTKVQAAISLSIAVAATAQKPSVAAAVGNAITLFVNTLPIGAPLPLTRIAQIAYAADPAVTNVSQLLINGAASDLVPPASGVVKAGLVAVN